jgi:hypothetical protein
LSGQVFGIGMSVTGVDVALLLAVEHPVEHVEVGKGVNGRLVKGRHQGFGGAQRHGIGHDSLRASIAVQLAQARRQTQEPLHTLEFV